MQTRCIFLIKMLKEWEVAIINFQFDAMRRYEIPEMVLCNPNKKEICMIEGLKNVKMSIKWQSCCELTFTAYSSYNGMKSEYYNKLEKGRLIHVIGFGYFVIQNYEQDFEHQVTSKDVTAYSAEYLLNFKGVNLTFVTTPASSTSTKVISKSYKFYDIINPEGTLLYELMSVCPQWKIQYVSTSLLDKRRSFDATDDGLYGFLCNTVAESYEAVFIFDYENYTVSAYDKDDVLKDTQIVMTFDNLLKNCRLEELSSDTYTVLNVTGADTLSIASINPTGSKKIFMLDYYVGSLDPNSNNYYENYNDWITDNNLKKKVLEWQKEVKRQMYLKETDAEYKQSYGYLVKQRKIFYKLLLTQKAAYTDQKTYFEAASQRMSVYQGETSDIAKKNYAIQQQRQAAFEANMIAIQKGGDFNTVNDDGTTELKYVISNDISDDEPYSKTWSIEALTAKVEAIDAQRDVIVNKYAFEKYFTSDEVAALEPYIREGDYSDSSFIVTDTMKITDYSNSETWVETTNGVKQIKDLEPDDTIIDETYICLQLLDAGYSKFEEVSQPSFTFTANSVNFLFSEKFKYFANELNFGSILNVELEDGFWVYPVFQTVDIDFDDPTSLSLGFSNRLRLNDSEWTWADLHNDTTSAVSNATSLIGSAATPVTNGTIDKVSNYITNTLIAANQAIQATEDNEFSFGSYGIRGRRVSTEAGAVNGYDPKQIWINNNLICFTDDAWKTTRLAIGYSDNGQYGIVADYVVGKLLAGDRLSISNENGSFNVTGDKATLTNCYLEVTSDKPDSSGNTPYVKISPDEIRLSNASIVLAGANNKSVTLTSDEIALTNSSISTTSGDFTTSLDPTRGLVIHRISTNEDLLYTTTEGNLYLHNINANGSFITESGNAKTELVAGATNFYYNNTKTHYTSAYSTGVESRWGFPSANAVFIRATSSDQATFHMSDGHQVTIQGNSNEGYWYAVKIGSLQGVEVGGDLLVHGTKNRIVKTSFGDELINAYETPRPSFGDYGTGVCEEDGTCFISLDPRFIETISSTSLPVWQITPYSEGNIWVEQQGFNAIVHGKPNQKFSWWVSASQKDYETDYAEIKDSVKAFDYDNVLKDNKVFTAMDVETNDSDLLDDMKDSLLEV